MGQIPGSFQTRGNRGEQIRRRPLESGRHSSWRERLELRRGRGRSQEFGEHQLIEHARSARGRSRRRGPKQLRRGRVRRVGPWRQQVGGERRQEHLVGGRGSGDRERCGGVVRRSLRLGWGEPRWPKGLRENHSRGRGRGCRRVGRSEERRRAGGLWQQTRSGSGWGRR